MGGRNETNPIEMYDWLREELDLWGKVRDMA